MSGVGVGGSYSIAPVVPSSFFCLGGGNTNRRHDGVNQRTENSASGFAPAYKGQTSQPHYTIRKHPPPTPWGQTIINISIIISIIIIIMIISSSSTTTIISTIMLELLLLLLSLCMYIHIYVYV